MEKNVLIYRDGVEISIKKIIKENRDFLKEHLELLIKSINRGANFKLKDIYDTKFDHIFAVKKLLGWWSSFFDDSKLKPVNLNKQKTSFTENPRYVLTLFIRDLIDNVVYREDLTFEAFKKIIEDFEKRKNVKFKTKRDLLLMVYGLLKEEDLLKNPSLSNIVRWVMWINNFYYKTKILNLLLWDS